MKTSDFEKEIQKIDPRLSIVPNPNRGMTDGNTTSLSNIKLDGRDVCPVPSEEIKDESDNNYRYIFPNGMSYKHNSKPEALAHIEQVLKIISTPEGADNFFDR